jgi:carbon starvation protein
MSAGWIKITSPDPHLGFLSHAAVLSEAVASGTVPAGVKSLAAAGRMIINDRVDAVLAAVFMVSVVVILVDSAREWWLIVAGRKAAVTTEVPFEARATAG